MPIKHLIDNDNTITEIKDITNTLVSTFSNNSSFKHYSHLTNLEKKNKEQNPVNFISDNTKVYNCPFSLRELTNSITKSHATSPGPDQIHFQ